MSEPVSTPSGRPVVDLSFGLELSGTFRRDDLSAAAKMAAPPPPAPSIDGATSGPRADRPVGGGAAHGDQPTMDAVATIDEGTGEILLPYPPFPDPAEMESSAGDAAGFDSPHDGRLAGRGPADAKRAAAKWADAKQADDAPPSARRVSNATILLLVFLGAAMIYVLVSESAAPRKPPGAGRKSDSNSTPFWTALAGFFGAGGALWWWARRRQKSDVRDDWQFVLQDEHYYLFNDRILHQTEWRGVRALVCDEAIVLDYNGKGQAIPRRFCRDTPHWKELVAWLERRLDSKRVADPPDYGGGGPYVQHDFRRLWTTEVTESPLVAVAGGKMSLADAAGITAITGSWRRYVVVVTALAAVAGLAWVVPVPGLQGFFAGVAVLLVLMLWLLRISRKQTKKQHQEWEEKHAPTVAVRTAGIELLGNRGRSIFRWEALRRMTDDDGIASAEVIGLYIEGARSVILLARRLFAEAEWRAVLGYVAKLPMHDGRL